MTTTEAPTTYALPTILAVGDENEVSVGTPVGTISVRFAGSDIACAMVEDTAVVRGAKYTGTQWFTVSDDGTATAEAAILPRIHKAAGFFVAAPPGATRTVLAAMKSAVEFVAENRPGLPHQAQIEKLSRRLGYLVSDREKAVEALAKADAELARVTAEIAALQAHTA